MTPLPHLKQQDISFDHPDSNNMFPPSPEKPMLATPEGAAPPLVFNVTHTRQLTLIALARSGELGIDAEPLAAGEAWSVGFTHWRQRVDSSAVGSEHRP